MVEGTLEFTLDLSLTGTTAQGLGPVKPILPTWKLTCDMGASENRGGPPKWMVKIMENPIKMDDLGVPKFSETKWHHIWSRRCMSKETIIFLIYARFREGKNGGLGPYKWPKMDG